MSVGGLVAGIIMVLAALAFGPWLCTRVWRDPAYADTISRGGRMLPFGYATSRGVTRGMLGLWFGLGFLGAGTIAVATLLPSGTTHQASAGLVTAVVLYGVGLIGIALNVAIVWFNQPRFLVPPHMRDEDGLVTAWWKARKLPPVQRRAAARARRAWPVEHRASSARTGRTR
jgi:hypothetical protein